MPNKVVLKNSSRSIPVVVSLLSDDRSQAIIDLENKLISPSSTESVIVKGGVKKLIVRKEHGVKVWEGMVPTYGTRDIVIFPEKAEVRYADEKLVNNLAQSAPGAGAVAYEEEEGYSKTTLSFIFFMIFLATFLVIYMGYSYVFKK